MKVGIYAPDVSPEEGGGYTYQRDIVDALAGIKAEAPHQFTTIGNAKDPPTGWDSRDYISLRAGIADRVVGRLRRSMNPATEGIAGFRRWRTDELFISRGIDLLWSVTAGSPTRELPYVTTVLDLQHRRQPIFPEVSTGQAWDYREALYARELRAASMVIVGNSTGQAEVERFYGVLPERIRQLPHPTPTFALDADDVQTDVLQRFELEPGFVLYPAQFWAHKNHVVVLHALAILRDRDGVALTAAFVGSDKGNRAHVERVAASLGLIDQLRFLGFVSSADLVTLYRQAFALTYLSYFGPENLPPLEAFALGCPVIAADVPGAREQLGDAARLVGPSDAEGLATLLLELRRNTSLRTELVNRGRARAFRQTPSTFVDSMLAVIDELAPIVHTWR